mmetsp:Transcript_18019/g.62358  ORF Transcript_18019/g.62358 Transcript_18019/m.62358 type:complete len:550 (-) Transcript_18019:1075-2724(-)
MRLRRVGRAPLHALPRGGPAHDAAQGGQEAQDRRRDARRGRRERARGAQDGRLEDHVEDRHLGAVVLPRRPDLRVRRVASGGRGRGLQGHGEPVRWVGFRGDGEGGEVDGELGELRDRRRRPAGVQARELRVHQRVAEGPRRRGARQLAQGRQAAPRGRPRGRRGRAENQVRRVRGRAPRGLALRAPRPHDAQVRRRAVDGGHPPRVHLHALRHGRHVARRALARDARVARHGHEPPRRRVQLRRGRRGQRPQRQGRRQPRHDVEAPQGQVDPRRRHGRESHPPGRVGPLRRHGVLPRHGVPDRDQGRPGRQARRGRPAPRRQGRRVHRVHPRGDRGRHAHLAAAAPRHLLHRGSGPAHPRPQVRQPRGRRVREARVRGRRRRHRRGRRQGQGGPHRHLRRRRRHGRGGLDGHQVRGPALGARHRRGAADARAQRLAGPHPAPDRRPAQDRARRLRRRGARRRGVRLLHGAAHRPGLHHDAQVPPQHVPRRHRDAGPRAPREIRRPAGARHQLLLPVGRGDARDVGVVGHDVHGRPHRRRGRRARGRPH